MELRQIRDFVAVYEEGGFTKAARRQNATQPGMSNSIAVLEEELGARLFDRGARGVSATTAGRRFYDHAVRVLQDVSIARDDMRWLAGEISGVVTVGLPTAIFRGRFAQLLLEYTERFPAVELRIIEAYSSTTLTSLIESHEVDFALVSQRVTSPHIQIEPFNASPLVLVSGKFGEPTPKRVKVSDLPPMKLVLPAKGGAMRSLVDDLLKLWNIDVRQTICVDGLVGMLDFMRLSDWKTFLPAVAVCNELREGSLDVSLIIDPEIRVEYVLARSSSMPLSQAAHAFLAQLRVELDKIDAEFALLT